MTEHRTYAPGTWIWIPDNEIVWRKAQVIESLNAGQLKVKIDNLGIESVLSAKVPTHICNSEIFSSDGLTGLDDLTQLTHLHEPAVLNSLNLRFDIDKIYTFTGPILIAVNPFKTISSMYDTVTIQRFLKSAEENTQHQKRIPHVFSTGSTAFRGLCDSKTSQTILISGESGAGKTESTKFVMQLLALAGSEDWNNRSQIENQVLQSNPLLEALGNAKTLRNDNSSRFGKFIEMQFTLQSKRGSEFLVGRLAGARIHTYLLETVRVCHQLDGERNYHSFYQLCSAAAASGTSGIYRFPSIIADKVPNAQNQEFDLSNFKSFDHFRYLTKSSCSKLARVNDLEEFEHTVLAMQTIGISFEEQVSIFNVIGAVLYLGNIQFEVPLENSEGSAIVPSSRPSFNLACRLLAVPDEVLEKALTLRTLVAKAETYKIPLKVRGAEDARDALAKALYGTAFLKTVKQTNESIGYREEVKLFCGVLDIFGFECFQLNSFEQLCINFTNERLQQFFNNFIFKLEEQLYMRENIPWNPLDFPDNADCVELMEKKNVGIFAMLDEECIVPGGSDKGFCNKMKEKHKDNKRFAAIKTKPEWFTINHFAGPVGYCVDGFLDKNKDQLSLDSQECIKESSSEFVRTLFIEFLNRDADEKGMKKRAVTVSSEFRNQLNYLMETVAETSPHFIRCIKPNPRNVPDEFERESVTEQLRYGGVLQAVQVSRAGYPIRLPHQEAYLEYKHLCSKPILNKLETEVMCGKEQASRMMVHLEDKFRFPQPEHSANAWAVGETMVFFKHESYEVLSKQRALLRANMAIHIQSRWKGKQQRLFYLHLLQCIVSIQAHIRGALARQRAHKMRAEAAAIRIQTLARRHLARAFYLRIRSKVIAVQSAWRGYKAKCQMVKLKEHIAARRIQCCWRSYEARNYYRNLRNGVLLAQLRWKQILAKRQLRHLRQEQREAAALLGQKERLQNENKQLRDKVEEATKNLLLATSERDNLACRVTEVEKELEQLKTELRNAKTQLQAPVDDLRATGICEQSPAPSSTSEKVLSSPVVSKILHRSGLNHVYIPSVHSLSPTNALSSNKLLVISPPVNELNAVHHRESSQQEVQVVYDETLKSKNAYIVELQAAMQQLEASLEKEKEKATAADQRYEHLKLLGPSSSSIAAEGITPSTITNGTVEEGYAEPELFHGSMKNIDILIIGDLSSGRSHLMDKLISEFSQSSHTKNQSFVDGDTSMRHHWIAYKGCSFVVAEFLEETSLPLDAVKEWAFKSHCLIIVYNVTAESSFRNAHQYIKMTSQHPYRICFGNLSALEAGAKIDVNIADVRDFAARSSCVSLEGSNLIDALEHILPELEVLRMQSTAEKISTGDEKAELNVKQGSSLMANRHGLLSSNGTLGSGAVLSNFMSRIHSYFGTSNKIKSGNFSKNNILRASTTETLPAAHRLSGTTAYSEGSLQAVTELSDCSAAITCIAFGRERAQRECYLLAAACKDGSVTVYQINRTELEKKIWDAEVAPSWGSTLATISNNSVFSLEGSHPVDNDSTKVENVKVLVQLFGHTRAVTHLFFSYKEDQLVTTSIDKSVRFWSLETGDMLKVFADSTSCLVAAFLPFNPSLFIVGNANSILRVVDVRNGKVLQKLRAESEVCALKFDETGLYCYAGTRNGMLHVLESCDSGNVQFKFKTRLSKSSITCITYVPSTGIDSPPQLFVNSCDSTITIVDCIYGHPTGTLSTLLVRHRVKVAHSLLPLRCCYSAVGGGWLISASEDRNVYIYSVAPNGGYRSVLLRKHQAPVVTVAVNQLNTVLASADSCGKLVLWRWVQFRPAETHGTSFNE